VSEAAPLLEVRDLHKSFPGVRALGGVRLTVGKGEVHALLGENGAGKSTLLKILAGAQQADAGDIRLDGVLLPAGDGPLDRQRAGLITIYQEFNLLPDMSVAENMYLGREPLRRGLIDWSRLHADARAILTDLGMAIDPRCEVRRLSVAQQQMVEIARAMTQNARLIVMDEPTAALSKREVTTLHRLIADLKARGVSVIYVTHRLEEVTACCDRFTVLRDGLFVADGDVADIEVGDLIRMMVGRDVEFARQPRRAPGEIVLSARAITRRRHATDLHAVTLNGLSLDLHAGEILGLAGLVGAGRSEFARILFGADKADEGALHLSGWTGWFRSPGHALDAGVALVPEDRKQQGCFLDHSIRLNLTLPSLARLAKWGVFIDARAERALVERYARALRIKMANAEVAIGTLSGGNQQKVLLARCMALRPRVLIVDEPTRGIDVGAKSEVHQLLADLAADGVAVVVISSELPEVMAISDRIAVFREGVLTGIVDGDAADEAGLMHLMAAETTPGRATA
jgi:inositol transport system ATP-binding protein